MRTPKRNKIIIVVSRPSELALTASGTIIKQARNKTLIKAIICTTENMEIDKKETYRAAKILGFEEVYFLKYKIGKLKTSGLDNVKEDIFQILEEEKPNIVIATAYHGYSQNIDGKSTSLAATLAYEKYTLNTQNKCKLYYYSNPEEFFKFATGKGFFRKDMYGFDFECVPDKKITHVIDFKNFVKKKIEALKEFKQDARETSRVIQLLKTYRSAAMDYFILAEVDGEKVIPQDFVKISSRL